MNGRAAGLLRALQRGEEAARSGVRTLGECPYRDPIYRAAWATGWDLAVAGRRRAA